MASRPRFLVGADYSPRQSGLSSPPRAQRAPSHVRTRVYPSSALSSGRSRIYPTSTGERVGVRGLLNREFVTPHPAHFVRRPLPVGEVTRVCGTAESEMRKRQALEGELAAAVHDMHAGT